MNRLAIHRTRNMILELPVRKSRIRKHAGTVNIHLIPAFSFFTFAAWALSLNASTWDFMSDGSVLVVFEFVSSFMGVPPYLHYIISVSSIRFSMKCMIWINGFLIISPMTSATTMKIDNSSRYLNRSA